MKKLRLKRQRKAQIADAFREANAVYQEIRHEPLDDDGRFKRDLLSHAVSYLQLFCLSITPKKNARSKTKTESL